MKFILSTAGSAAIKVFVDDVVPRGGVRTHDLIEFVKNEYQFAVSPTIPPGVAPFLVTMHMHQSGVFVDTSTPIPTTIPIIQLLVVPNGEIVTAGSTHAADSVLNNLTARLDEALGFRFSSTERRSMYYHSVVVVQFEPGISEKLEAFRRIENVLNLRIARPNAPFEIKRLAFGHGDPTPIFTPTSLEAIENADFTIERRIGEPYSENRYSSSAPVRTEEHIQILEEIERALS
jgi:hypothetical protein